MRRCVAPSATTTCTATDASPSTTARRKSGTKHSHSVHQTLRPRTTESFRVVVAVWLAGDSCLLHSLFFFSFFVLEVSQHKR
eukprot:m.153170 g.153170  ORF g.153170 m.153170 type:complete len:82 (+) comp52854_c0_seq2:1106-1351(+)